MLVEYKFERALSWWNDGCFEKWHWWCMNGWRCLVVMEMGLKCSIPRLYGCIFCSTLYFVNIL